MGKLDQAATEMADICKNRDEALARLPPKPRRNAGEAAVAEALKRELNAARARFLRAHVEDVYRSLTFDLARPVRAEDLVYAAAERFPGLVPRREAVAVERRLMQAEKDGLE